MMKALFRAGLAGLLCVSGCATALPPIKPVPKVDIPRYMGRWYVVGAIPTRFERHSYNPVEAYALAPDGTICTHYRYRKGGFDGPVAQITSRARLVRDGGGARWQVELAWFLKTQYLVAWLAPDYSQVIVARDRRDYLWYMARTPTVSKADYQAMLSRVAAMGYDPTRVVKAPQRWPDAALASGPGRITCRP